MPKISFNANIDKFPSAEKVEELAPAEEEVIFHDTGYASPPRLRSRAVEIQQQDFVDLEKFEAAFMEEPEPVHIKQEPEHEHTKTVKCTKEETDQLCVIFTAVAGAFIIGAISGGVLVYALSSSAGPLED